MRIRKELKVQSVGGENIILLQGIHGVDTTKIVSLNETSLWLWNHFADKDFTAEEVADSLVAEFGITKELARKDAAAWVEMMTKNSLIEQ